MVWRGIDNVCRGQQRRGPLLLIIRSVTPTLTHTRLRAPLHWLMSHYNLRITIHLFLTSHDNCSGVKRVTYAVWITSPDRFWLHCNLNLTFFLKRLKCIMIIFLIVFTLEKIKALLNLIKSPILMQTTISSVLYTCSRVTVQRTQPPC